MCATGLKTTIIEKEEEARSILLLLVVSNLDVLHHWIYSLSFSMKV